MWREYFSNISNLIQKVFFSFYVLLLPVSSVGSAKASAALAGLYILSRSFVSISTFSIVDVEFDVDFDVFWPLTYKCVLVASASASICQRLHSPLTTGKNNLLSSDVQCVCVLVCDRQVFSYFSSFFVWSQSILFICQFFWINEQKKLLFSTQMEKEARRNAILCVHWHF